MIVKKAFLIFSMIVVGFLAFGLATPASVAAQACDPNDNSGTCCGDRVFLGLPAWDKYLEHENENGRCTPVFEGLGSVLPISIAVLEAVIRLGGLVAVVMIIVGSFKFMTSQGNADNAAAARKTIINSLIGLVIVVIATSVVGFLGNTLADSAQADIKGWASIDNGVRDV